MGFARPIPARRVACRLAYALLLGAAAVPARGAEPFCIVALPDTQFYSEKFPETFLAQTAWIARRRAGLGIAFVTHLGDVVQHAGATNEWARALRALEVLDGAVPYSVCLGNHDAGARLYDARLGPARFAGRPWYVGGSPNGRSHAQRFRAGDTPFLHLALQHAPDAEALDWAQGVIGCHPGLPTVLSTHDYLGLRGRTARGEAIWSRLVRRNPQVFLVLNGHTHGENRQVSTNDAGGLVIEMLSDYQNEPAGGEDGCASCGSPRTRTASMS